jgi:hypothetical protein
MLPSIEALGAVTVEELVTDSSGILPAAVSTLLAAKRSGALVDAASEALSAVGA